MPVSEGVGRTESVLLSDPQIYRRVFRCDGWPGRAAFHRGIGQGSEMVRALAVQGLASMGIRLDDRRNREARGFDEVCRISADDSKVTVLVVPTDEERMMAARLCGH